MKLKIVTAALLLGACGAPSEQQGNSTAATEAEPAVLETPLETPEVASVLLGTVCFRHEDESVTEGLEIEVAESGAVSGYHFGTIHNEEAGYFAAFETDLTGGTLGEDDTATFQTYTEVDGDEQTGEDTWRLTVDGAQRTEFDDIPTLRPFPCEDLILSVWPPLEE